MDGSGPVFTKLIVAQRELARPPDLQWTRQMLPVFHGIMYYYAWNTAVLLTHRHQQSIFR